MQKFYAHSVKGKPTREWQGLHAHLLNVASLAREFAEVFNSGDWAYLTGLRNGLGKYSAYFQKMLLAAAGSEAYILQQSQAGWIIQRLGQFMLMKPSKGMAKPIEPIGGSLGKSLFLKT